MTKSINGAPTEGLKQWEAYRKKRRHYLTDEHSFRAGALAALEKVRDNVADVDAEIDCQYCLTTVRIEDSIIALRKEYE